MSWENEVKKEIDRQKRAGEIELLMEEYKNNFYKTKFALEDIEEGLEPDVEHIDDTEVVRLLKKIYKMTRWNMK
tara:strand:+ start:339 stop:560 length:222 start_codon:yes stop_codon:yes gene_type:complete